MKYEETDHNGSFTAQGIGFLYEYYSHSKGLHIFRAGRKAPILSLGLDQCKARDAYGYVQLLDKAAQIKALKFSNYSTINLVGTLDDVKLPGILTITSQIADCAFYLRGEKFARFQELFLEMTDLKRMETTKVAGYDAGTAFYVAIAETRRGDVITARSCTLHAAMNYLSDKLVREIIGKEFGYGRENWTQAILDASLLLAMISLILNERFDPGRKIGSKGMPIPSAFAASQKTNIIQ